MASSADIRAGRAFVELYVRDYLFRQRLLEDRAMLEDVMADAGQRGPTDEGITTTGDAYAELADIADQSLETLYQDTLYLTEATQELLEVLNEVMDTYLGLSDIQTEGVSLSVGGPQQAGIGGPGGEQRFGFSLSDMKKQLGEGMEGVPEVAVKAVGAKIGAAIFRSDAFQNALSYLPFTKTIRQGASKEGAGGQAGTELSVPVMQLLNQTFIALGQSAVLAAQALQAMSRATWDSMKERMAKDKKTSLLASGELDTSRQAAQGGAGGAVFDANLIGLLNQAFVALGQSAVLAAQALQALSRSGGGGGGPVIDVAFKAKGLETVHDEMITALAPVEFHSPGVLPVKVKYEDDLSGAKANKGAWERKGGLVGLAVGQERITKEIADAITNTLTGVKDGVVGPQRITKRLADGIEHATVATFLGLRDAIIGPNRITAQLAQGITDASVSSAKAMGGLAQKALAPVMTSVESLGNAITASVKAVEVVLVGKTSKVSAALQTPIFGTKARAPKQARQKPEEIVDAELVGRVQSADAVMAQLAKSTQGADSSLARLAQSLQSAGTAIPVVGQDVTKAGQAVGMLSKAFHAAKWALTTLGPWLIAIAAAVAAAYAAFKTLQLAVAAVKLPFQVAAKAVEWFVAGIKSLPNLIGWTVGALKRLTVAGYDAAKSLGAGVWSGVSATFRGINSAISAVGSTIKATGKGLAYLGAGMTALGALITVPLTKAAQKFAEMGNHIKVLTEQYKVFGMTAEQASVYSYAASQASGLLGTLGEAERIQYLMRTMRTGTAEYEKWRKQAELSGAVMTGGALAGAKVLTEAYHRLTGALQGLWASLGQAVGPAVADWTEIVVGAIRGATQWVRQNQQLIVTVSKVATAIGTVGSVIAAAGTALMGLGAAISPLTALLAAVAAGMAVVEYKTRVGATLWGSYSDSVVKLYGTVMTFLKPILEETQKVIGGIVNAVKGGDLALAAKIAWAGLKLAWSEGLLWLSEQTGETFGAVLKNLAGGNWKAAADGAVGMIKAAFLSLKLVMYDVWDGIQGGFDTVMGAIEKGWSGLWNIVKRQGLVTFTWLLNNVFAPIVKKLVAISNAMQTMWLPKSVKDAAYESAKASKEALKTLVESHGKMKESILSPEQLAKNDDRVNREVADKQAARQQANADRRKEIETQIAELQKRGVVEGTVSGNQARSNASELRDKIAQLNQEAEKLKKEGKQPTLPEYLGKTSGLISSSAYAFGSLGMGGGSVQDRQLEIQRKTLEEARKKEVAERASRNYTQKILEAQRDRLAEMTEYMKKMGIYRAT